MLIFSQFTRLLDILEDYLIFRNVRAVLLLRFVCLRVCVIVSEALAAALFCVALVFVTGCLPADFASFLFHTFSSAFCLSVNAAEFWFLSRRRQS